MGPSSFREATYWIFCVIRISITSSSSISGSCYTVSNLERASVIFCSCIFKSFSSLIFLNIQLNLFFTLFSVRPGNYLTISDHLLPIYFLNYKILRSSSGVNGSLFISGLRKLYHLSLHCLPFLFTPSNSFKQSAISCHCLVPLSEIILKSSSSSRFYH